MLQQEGIMKKERVLKKDWPNFLKNFNAEHQFRPVRVSVGGDEISKHLPFIGMVYEEKKKDVEVFVGGVDIEHPAHLIHTAVSPRALYVLRDGEEVLGIEVQSAKGPKVVVEFNGPPEEAEKAKKALIEKIAYELFLRRGGEHGKDVEDWLEAEKIVERIAQMYI